MIFLLRFETLNLEFKNKTKLVGTVGSAPPSSSLWHTRSLVPGLDMYQRDIHHAGIYHPYIHTVIYSLGQLFPEWLLVLGKRPYYKTCKRVYSHKLEMHILSTRAIKFKEMLWNLIDTRIF